MAKIEINGKKLHEISMKLRNEGNSSRNLSYPDHRIKSEIENDNLIIELPLQLALALYNQTIISQDDSITANIRIKGKNKGHFKIIDLIYPDSLYTENAKIIFKKNEKL